MSWYDESSSTRRGSVPCAVAESFYEGVKDSSSWQRLENKECMEQYSVSFLSKRRNLLLVSNTTKAEFTASYNATSSTFGALNSTSWNQRAGMDWLADGWLCKYAASEYLDQILESGQTCSTARMTLQAQSWQIQLQNGTFPVQYCLSETVPEQCKLQSLLVILLGVTCMNLCKLICMILGLFVMNDRPLMVIGDAAASFLRYPDEVTVGKCLCAESDFWRSTWSQLWGRLRKRVRSLEPEPKLWDGKRYKWFRAAPSSNWSWYWVW